MGWTRCQSQKWPFKNRLAKLKTGTKASKAKAKATASASAEENGELVAIPETVYRDLETGNWTELVIDLTLGMTLAEYRLKQTVLTSPPKRKGISICHSE